MCGRFALLTPGEEIAAMFDLDSAPAGIVARYNIAPTQPVATVRLQPGTGRRELTYCHWGLIPSWAKDHSLAARMINARAETAAEKPAFRAAYKYRRCLIPASGFYEWQPQNGAKQPLYIHPAGGQLLALAGLWEHWQSPDGSEIDSCTILTTGPNAFMHPIHNRMPVIVDPADFELWLRTDGQRLDQLQHLLRPAPDELLTAHPVSTYVNSPRNEGPQCIAPAG